MIFFRHLLRTPLHTTLTLLALAAIAAAAFIPRSAPILIPAAHSTRIESFSDQRDFGGQSTVNRFEKNAGTITLDFTLQHGIAAPYAGISIIESPITRTTDKHRAISLRMSSATPTSVRISLFVMSRFATPDGDIDLLRPLSSEISLKSGELDLQIPLASFGTTEIWYKNHAVKASQLVPRNRPLIEFVTLGSSAATPIHIPQHWTIKRLSFVR